MVQVIDPPSPPWVTDYDRLFVDGLWTGRILTPRPPWYSPARPSGRLAMAGLIDRRGVVAPGAGAVPPRLVGPGVAPGSGCNDVPAEPDVGSDLDRPNRGCAAADKALVLWSPRGYDVGIEKSNNLASLFAIHHGRA